MSSPVKTITSIPSKEVRVPLQQPAMEEPKPVGSTTIKKASRVSKPKKNKKKLNNKKSIVPRRMYLCDSYEGTEERVPEWDEYVAARGYCSDLDKLM